MATTLAQASITSLPYPPTAARKLFKNHKSDLSVPGLTHKELAGHPPWKTSQFLRTARVPGKHSHVRPLPPTTQPPLPHSGPSTGAPSPERGLGPIPQVSLFAPSLHHQRFQTPAQFYFVTVFVTHQPEGVCTALPGT